MTSPAEAYQEAEYARKRTNRKATVDAQYDILIKMLQTVGFGYKSADTWVEREIYANLEAALRLLELERKNI